VIGRRAFISRVAAASVTWPTIVSAQQRAMPVIGLLGAGTPEGLKDEIASFSRGLKEGGYVEGRNLTIEWRWANGDYALLNDQAIDLVRRNATVIATAGSVAAATAARAATQTIPIVFSIGADPIKSGLVESLNHPSENITGVSFFGGPVLEAKRLELLNEVVPREAAVAYLVNPSNPSGEGQIKEIEAAANSLGRHIQVLKAHTESEITAVLDTIDESQTRGLQVAGDAFFFSRRAQITTLAARHGLAGIYQSRAFVVAGGLMSYGTSIDEAYHQVGVYVARILGGAKPAELPVVQSTKFELVINGRVAKTLGLQVAPKFIATADEVIE
jgi:putative tryptophan/tyrosine transport system substrate-binding protein